MAERSNKVIPTQTTYEDDFYGWLNEQANALRAGDLDRLDLGNLAEEIEGLSASERRELHNRLTVLLMHLLKWEHQPQHQSRSWRATINEQRRQLELLLNQSPSLRPRLADVLPKAYQHAVSKALEETGFLRSPFPEICPYPVDEILSEGVFPKSTTTP